MSASMTALDARRRRRRLAAAPGRRLVIGGHGAHRSAARKSARRTCAARWSAIGRGPRRRRLGPAWALLTRLATGRLPLQHPPQRRSAAFSGLAAKARGGAARSPAAAPSAPDTVGLVGKLGRWSVLQGGMREAVSSFFGRIVTVLGEAISAAAGVAAVVAGAACLRDRHHRHSHRVADRLSDQRDRGLSGRAAAVAGSAPTSSWSTW